MKKQIKTTEAIFPMPVLLIATFNEDGTVNVMNAAWGTMVSRDIVALNLTETHTTVSFRRTESLFRALRRRRSHSSIRLLQSSQPLESIIRRN